MDRVNSVNFSFIQSDYLEHKFLLRACSCLHPTSVSRHEKYVTVEESNTESFHSVGVISFIFFLPQQSYNTSIIITVNPPVARRNFEMNTTYPLLNAIWN